MRFGFLRSGATSAWFGMPRVRRLNINWSNSWDRERERDCGISRTVTDFIAAPYFLKCLTSIRGRGNKNIPRNRRYGSWRDQGLMGMPRPSVWRMGFATMLTLTALQVLSQVLIPHSWLFLRGLTCSSDFQIFPTDSAALPGRLRASAKYRKSRRRGSQKTSLLDLTC